MTESNDDDFPWIQIVLKNEEGRICVDFIRSEMMGTP